MTKVEQGVVLDGGYRLDYPAAVPSAMSEVWAATRISTGERVAVKLLDESRARDPYYVARFDQEIRIGMLLRSVPEVVHVLASGYDTEIERPFFVMEWMDESLADRLRESTVLDVEEAVEWAAAMLRALAVAHRKGILHRDLKPQNVMRVALSDGSSRIAVSDFGIASLGVPGRITPPDARIGTPPYAAPEQRDGMPVTVRSDLYSVGFVTYEALTGRRPWDGPTDDAVRRQQELLRCPPVNVHNPAVPEALARAIASSLELEPSKRPESAAGMLDALARVHTPLTPALGETAAGAGQAGTVRTRGASRPVRAVGLVWPLGRSAAVATMSAAALLLLAGALSPDARMLTSGVAEIPFEIPKLDLSPGTDRDDHRTTARPSHAGASTEPGTGATALASTAGASDAGAGAAANTSPCGCKDYVWHADSPSRPVRGSDTAGGDVYLQDAEAEAQAEAQEEAEA